MEILTPAPEFTISFFIMAVIAVLIIGISKGGFVGGFGMLAVPMLAMFIDPRQAAAILLPILIAMDFFAVKEYRLESDVTALKSLLPGAIIGIVIGGLTFALMNSDMVRVMVGGLSLYFVAHYLYMKYVRKSGGQKLGYNHAKGGFWGMIGGFTSFIAHAGGAPFSIYVLPLKLPKRILLGTSVIFFMVVNLLKLIPYFILGQLAFDNLLISLYLLPLAPIGIKLGVYLQGKLSEKLFYILCYVSLFVVGLKLTYSGLMGAAFTGL
jgi:uncharacterized membrane protein YfcA